MAEQCIFVAARALSEMVYKYVAVTARELGSERALSLLSEVSRSLALHQAEVIRQTYGARGYDARKAFSVGRTVVDLAFGMDLKPVHESRQRVVANSGPCPVFEACELWGIDPKSMCRAGPSLFMDVMLKQLNPALSYQILKFRTAAGDFCQAAVVEGEPYSFPA